MVSVGNKERLEKDNGRQKWKMAGRDKSLPFGFDFR